MTRNTAREIAIQLGFAASAMEELPQEMMDKFFDRDYYATLGEEDELYSEYPNEKHMEYIRRYATGWKIGRSSKTALAVLRCAICEIMYMDDVPNAAAINEAVELDKGYDEPDTVAFVNGVLGGFMRGEINIPADEAAQAEEAVPGAGNAAPDAETTADGEKQTNG